MSYVILMRRLIEAVSPRNGEDWRVVTILGRPVNVGWGLAKNASNKRKHNGLSLSEGIFVLDNHNSKAILQQEINEERDQYIGPGKDGKLLVVIVEWIETGEEYPSVRIISVRYAEPGESNER